MSYERHYEGLAGKSPILSEGAAARDGIGGHPVDFPSRQAVQKMINEYIVHNGRIPQARAAVDDWEKQVAQHQRTMKALGHGGQAPPPDDMQDSLDHARAYHDVLLAERDKLYEIRDSFEEQAGEERRQKIINSIGGLQVTTEFDAVRNLYRTAFDHQCVSLINTITGSIEHEAFNTRDGEDLARVGDQHVVIIDDPASPFDGMSLQAYRGIVDEVKRQRSAMAQRWKKENAKRPVDEREPETNITARARQYKPTPWPPEWIKGAKNYKAAQHDSLATG